MLRQYTNELKNYNFLQKITEGYFIDAKDEGRWKVGRVQQIRRIGHKTCVDVMFDGYSSKYNETYDLPSYSKLAPFRRFTAPYTGDPRYEPRREEPSKSLEHYMKVINKISNEMGDFKSEEINQIVRGQLFVYVDYCMTLSLRQESKYQFEEYMRLFFAYLEMVDKVMDKVIQFLKQVEKQGNLDQNYIYVYPKMAWLYALTEMLFNCCSMINKRQQRATFHRYFGKHQSPDAVYSMLTKKIQALKMYEKCQRLINFKTVNGAKSLPWSIKKEALILIKSLNPQQKILLPKDTKEVIQFIQCLPYLTLKGIISREDEEKYRNELVFHLILSGNFEGKLIGLSELKRSITSISSLHSVYKKQKEERESTYIELIKEKNLIGFFLDNNNFNSQLFKRSLIVFQFAYRNKLFTKDHFPLVLKLHKDKHELELKNFYSSLAEFGSFMDPNDAVDCFQTMIKELPVEENFIELIKNYTLSTIDKNPHFKKIYMNKDSEGFGLIYFWDLINSQTKINKELMPKVIQSFATLLNDVYFGKQIERFIVSSIKAIKDAKNSEFFLKVIHESIKLCKGSRMNRAIETAQKEINVIEAAMNMLRQQENSLSSSGFENLFEFLEEVNYISRKGLSQGDITFLWKMDKAKCRSHLLKFLRKYKLKSNDQKSQQRIISKSLELSQIEFIIKNIFESEEMMEGFKQIDMEHFDTIDELILCYLHNKKFIDYNYKHTIRYKRNEFFVQDDKVFLGMAFYLKCIEFNHDKFAEVTTKAIKRLVDIFLRPLRDEFPGKNYDTIKAKNWIRLSKAFDSLKNSRLKCFQIQLQEIHGRMKSLNILSNQSIDIRVKNSQTNQTHFFTVPRFTSLWKFRLLINEKFDLKDTNFEIELIEQSTSTNLERQEDLSVAFICLAKEKYAPSVLVNPSKEQHPHFKTIDKFKEELCDMIGEGLYKNLTSQNDQKSSDSLEILLKLPFLKTLQKSIQNLDFKEWQQILDPQNMKKLEYQLKVIQKVRDMKWVLSFISKSGMKHLTDVVLANLGKGNYRTLNLLMPFFNEAVQFNMKNPFPFGEQFLKDILFYEKQKTDEYITFLINCFSLIKYAAPKIKLSTFFEKDKMAQILEYVLFDSKKSAVSAQIIEICKINNTYVNLNKQLRGFLNFDYLKTKMNQCYQFFEVLRTLIERGELAGISDQIQQLFLQIRNSEIRQKSQNEVNELLYGYLSCVYQFLKVNRLEDIFAESKEKFFMHLLNECLFHPQNIAFRKFKSKQLRELGFKFLEILEFETKKDNEIDKLLIPMMAKGSWRKQYDWQIEPVEFINKNFTGLKNLAATCYINSLLQQLFYIRNFSSQLMAVDAEKIEDKENIVREIQNIFGFLKYSQNPSYTTLSLCQNFILDGQPIDPRIQTDVDEFFHALMDKLERNLQKIGKKEIINEVFRGEFSNMIIGQECPHASERIEHFLSIRLEIKNKKTIYQALDEFIKGEILQGDNAYFCEKCDKKVKALKRVCLKDLPPVMIVTLKRFEFDFDTMQKFKLNTYCSFPENINFLPYTKQGLQEDSDAKKEDYEYKLKGVVIHYGISEAGHYTSYVRTDDKAWNYFDDERISEFDLKEMESECFGGIEENPFGDDEEKKKNAYLLIYEKIKPSSELKEVSEQVLAQSKVYQLVEEDNIKTKMVNLLFEPNIETYIFNLSEVNPRVFLIYYHTVFLRSKKKQDKYVEFYQMASELLTKKPIAEWYLKQITESFLMEFVIFGDYEVKYIVASLIIQAMKISVDLEFMQQCVALLSNKMMMPLVKIFGIAPNLHPDYAKYLSSINFGQVVLNLIKGKEIKETSVIKKAQSRKNISEFGMAASSFIQKKIFDPKDLFQAIESVKTGITLEQIKGYCTEIRSKRTIKSLAIITAKKYKDLDQFKKFLDSFFVNELFTLDPKVGEETYFAFLIMVLQEFCKIKDKDQEQRVTTLAKLYIDLMRDAIVGFKCQLMLLNGFFRISMTNSVFKNTIALLLNDKENKKLVSALKDWLKDLPNVIPNIKSDKWGWWKKPKKQYPGLSTEYVINEVKPALKEALSMLNSIIQKHPIEEVSEWLEIGNAGYFEQKNNKAEYCTITRKMGFLVEVKDDHSNHRFACEDEIIKKFI